MARKSFLDKEPEKNIEEKPTFIPFIEKGKVFQSQTNTKWLINFDKIPELIEDYSCVIKNWYNWKFNNPCICPSIFLNGGRK